MASGDVKLYCMKAGLLHLDESVIVHGSRIGTRITMPVLMFLIDHPRGRVLYETGYYHPAGDEHSNLADMGGAVPETTPEEGVVSQLTGLGLVPDDIDYVVLSCLYFDHAGGLVHFPKSTVIVQREEVEEWLWPTEARKLIIGDVYPDALERARGFRFLHPETDEFDVFGDGKVLVIRAPCHARGEQAMMVRLSNTGPVVLPGGVLPHQSHLDGTAIQGRLMVSPDEALRSMTKLRQVIARERATVLLHHDPEAWRGYKLAPDFYD